MVKLTRKAKDPFDGIINYFTVNSANVFDYFSASGSVYRYYGSPNTVLNHSFEGTALINQWCSALNDPVITFTLKCPIFLTHYRLKTRNDGNNGDFPISWKVEGMLDDDSWTTIDTKTDRTELKGLGYAHTFECDTQQTVKQIKITATEVTNYMHLILSRVEFFGSMNLNQCQTTFHGLCVFQNTCSTKRTSILIYMFIIISIY